MTPVRRHILTAVLLAAAVAATLAVRPAGYVG